MSAVQDVAYIRVSSVDQCIDRQLEKTRQTVSFAKVFTDKCSGKDLSRPALHECIDYVREGDTVHVHSIDRLARCLQDLLVVIKTLTDKGVTVRFESEGLSFKKDQDDPTSALMLNLLGSFAEFERALIKERQREGIEAAKRAGKRLGRRKALTDTQVSELRAKAASGVSSCTALAREFGISRASLYRYIKD